jgi:hypothetical protein
MESPQYLPVATQQAKQGYAVDEEDAADILDTTKLRRQYQDYAAAKSAEGYEMLEARHYYHGDQWTREEIRTLRDRKQPVVTSNRIVRSIQMIGRRNHRALPEAPPSMALPGSNTIWCRETPAIRR